MCRHLLGLAVLAMAVFIPSPASAQSGTEAGGSPAVDAFNFVPWPQSVQRTGDGSLTILRTAQIVAGDASLVPLSKVLSENLFLLTGVKLRTATSNAKDGDIILKIDPEVNKNKKEEAYRLAVAEKNVTITGLSYIGAAHGASLLLQAVSIDKNGLVVPRITVDDYPYSEYNGTMLDIARQDNSPDYLRMVISLMHVYRIRYLQLHLNDFEGWTVQSKLFPKLGTANGAAHGGPAVRCISQAEWLELVKYADERGVTLVPEIESIGHYGALLRGAPESFGPDYGAMNVCNPGFYAAMDKLVGEVLSLFRSSPYVHIGCDEIGLDGVFKSNANSEVLKNNKIANPSDLFAWHIAQMHEIVVKKFKRKMIVWEDAGASPDLQ